MSAWISEWAYDVTSPAPAGANAAYCYSRARGELLGARHYFGNATGTVLRRGGRARRASHMLEAVDCLCAAATWRAAARAARRACEP